jgi:DNA mismatch repair ATPase MutS
LLYAILYFTQRNQISSLFDEALSLENVLDKFSFVFRYLETRRPKNKPHLRKLCEPFLDPQNRPSRHLRHIARISQAAQLQRNPFLWLIVNAVFPWDLYFVFRLHQHRAKIAKLLPRWLDVWFELEALLSLANFAHLHPDYTFPKIVSPERESSVLLEARSLGHPLISPREKVCNDFKLTAPGEIAIVTGSNMSGKSTFLRTIGINLRLAQAGGPVNAREFTTTPFRVFACIKVSDSLADGISYFYAEVKRLKTLLLELQKPHPAPLFFLIDEIFKGTNHRERLLGSSAYIRALTREKGLGLIATHDLELVKLENEFSQIKNYHFREEIFDGRMLFDYKLHPGPCPTTNALKIMEMEGLPVSL